MNELQIGARLRALPCHLASPAGRAPRGAVGCAEWLCKRVLDRDAVV